MKIGTDIITEKNILNAQNIKGVSKCNKSEKNAVNEAKEPLGQPIMDLDEKEQKSEVGIMTLPVDMSFLEMMMAMKIKVHKTVAFE